ncbi:haloacid dehalogenase type II [Thalassobaculum sp. OXR-137]|uniref:haloacid dehalogenase type II n=1 Tax=Thalassobaculum sp. OXR-137 TaxID=3100173 RepID=UPI002AC962C6|nr:haloacid dehalogenase type II [Thalassobaculum sp. OXR-137]WPZ33906.1 haloacid dehalogenase type II [Thalassobaculum sp. OXR-137]
MSLSQIRYISFDCYGTLTDFRVGDVTRARLADRVDSAAMPGFLEDFTAFRFDEVLGAWKPYPEVLHRALERTCKRWGVTFNADDAQAIVDAIPSWGPHPDVPAGLARAAQKLPLVVLSNASDSQIQANVDKLGAPFHAVLTAEQAQAYKPRFQAFEYMFDTLGCGPEHVMHVSSSLRYDLMTAHDLRIAQRVFVERGHGPGNPAYGYRAIADIGGLPGLLGA